MKANRDIVDTPFNGYLFENLLEDLLIEIQAKNYRVTRINHIDNIHERQEAGIEVAIAFKYYKIVEFCNLNSCSELISADLKSGVFMPVRYVVYQVADDTEPHIAFLKPTAFANLFDSRSLLDVARQLEADMNHVLDELVY